MGYDVHITRAEDWTKTEGVAISAEEWKQRVESDPELLPDPANGPHAVLWQAHPDGRNDAWLDWLDGNVYTTNPDQPLLEKMLGLAAQLKATVVGDDNKIYDTVEDLVE